MPCYDSRDDEDRVRNEKHVNALTAILCGVMSVRPASRTALAATEYAKRWKLAHDRIDAARGKGKRDWDDEVMSEQALVYRILDEAYQDLCEEGHKA